MSQTIPQTAQARAAAALAALLTERPDAPMASWSLSQWSVVTAELVGQISGSARDVRTAVAAWARILGVTVEETARGDEDGTWIDVRASATSGGVSIEVWAMVVHPLPEAVTA